MKHHPISSITGLEYVYAGINENKTDLYPKIFHALWTGETQTREFKVFATMFDKFDDVLKKGGDVFVHCNAGEHRSASVAVLYVQRLAKCTFAEAHKYVQQFRTIIKPVKDNHVTLMTEFNRLSKNDEQAVDLQELERRNTLIDRKNIASGAWPSDSED